MPELALHRAGIAGLFASLGLGRFSLGMMLPSMGEMQSSLVMRARSPW